MSQEPELSVVVFAFNEGENVEHVLQELLQWLQAHEPRAEVILVDDGSSDDTRARAQQALRGSQHQVLSHEQNRGIGAALKTGVRAARGEWITFMPADGQIEPQAIGTLRGAARGRDVDVVFSVYDHRDDGWFRTFTSWGVRALIRIVHGVKMRSDGPYLFRRVHFDPDLLKPDSFFLNFEFPIRALARGLSIATVTIACRPRRGGYSKSATLRTIRIIARDTLELKLRRAFER